MDLLDICIGNIIPEVKPFIIITLPSASRMDAADMAGTMPAEQVFLVTMMVITWISGVALSSSVVMVYITEWKKKRQISVCDRIFAFMAFTNLLLQSSISINVLTYLFWLPQLETDRGLIMMCSVIFSYLIYDNTWHSAWLAGYYCVTLVNSSHRVFVLLKHRLSSSMTQLLIATSAALFLINLPFMWTVTVTVTHNNSSSPREFTLQNNQLFMVFNVLLGFCLPFVVTLVCIGLSVGALLRHIWRMRSSSSQFTSSPQLQGHVRAVRTMTLHALLNFVLYVSLVIVVSPFKLVWVVVPWLAIMFHPSIQIITLIMGNPRLEKKLQLWRHLVSGGLDQR
ncbi:taste receptor type 2 member 40-like [Dendropsophus ebraccatus]|uniref:taste receptor type 2 member 40-like n=1 Tax=Dendropsophus ebraccatus TaxID=150705 RepID=UPI003831155E